MHDFIKKLLDSKSTIIILLWMAVFAWAYNLDWSKKPIVQQKPKGRPIEEIIATPVNKTVELVWDNEFQSAIIPIKEGE
jgi:hypothetical protein